MEATELRYPSLDRVIYPDHVISVQTAVSEGLIPDANPATLLGVREAGYCPMDLVYKLTSDSRKQVTLPIICSRAAVAARQPHILVQTAALAVARRQIGARWDDWDSRAHCTVRKNGDNKYILGAQEDGRWRERRGGVVVREWLLEYTHGEFTARRLQEVIRQHGRCPQMWLTPSRAHAAKITRVLAETLPDYPHVRVEIVNWTAGLHALP